MMKGLLDTAFARRLAWMTLVAVVAAIVAPGAQPPAQAQDNATLRSAYLVPIEATAGVDKAVTDGLTSALAKKFSVYKGDARVGKPLDILPAVVDESTGKVQVSPKDPIVKRALADKVIDQATIDNPPATLADAQALCAKLGLRYTISGKVVSYKQEKSADGKTETGTLDFEVYLDDVPLPTSGAHAQTVSRTLKLDATTEPTRLMLRTTMIDTAAQFIVATLLSAPDLMPKEPTPPTAPGHQAGISPWVWLLVPIILVGGIYMISSVKSGTASASTALQPQNVTAASLANSVQITWTQAVGAVGYNVYRQATGNQPLLRRSRRALLPALKRGAKVTKTMQRAVASGFTLLPNPQTNTVPTVTGSNRTSFIDSTAVSGTIYEYAVTGLDANNNESALSVLSIADQAGANIGSPPVLASTAGDGFVSLNWTASSSFVSGYFVFRHQGGQPDANANSPDQIAQLGTVLNFNDSTVTDGDTYTYVVEPFTTVNTNQQLAGNLSNQVTIQPTAGAPPLAPTNVVATASTTGVVTVTWNADAGPVASYEVLRLLVSSSSRTPSSGAAAAKPAVARATRGAKVSRAITRQVDLTNYSVVGTTNASTTTFTDNPGNGTYQYAVRAVSTAGVRGPVGVSSQVAVSAPSAPPTALAATATSGSVTLSWQAPTGNISLYRLYRSTTAITAAMTGVATAPGITMIGTSSTLTYKDTNVTNNTQYFYAVTAVTAANAESLFGKGAFTNSGVPATPHAAPATLTLTTNKQVISANGISTALITAKVLDATGAVVPGVNVTTTMTTTATSATPPTFVGPFPVTDASAATSQPQVSAQTDATGQVTLNFQSAVLTQAGSPSADIQATATDPALATPLQSAVSVAMQASVPAALLMNPPLITITADGASTQNVSAQVLDSLGNPVPNGQFNVDFALSADNGALREAGNLQTYPFQRYPAVVLVPVVGGVASAVYRAGTTAGSVQISANVDQQATIGSACQVQLTPGAATQVTFQSAGATVSTVAVPVSGTNTVSVVVKDSQGNPVGAGTAITFTEQPTGVVTVPATGTTDATGQFALTLTGGTSAANAVVVATVGTIQAQLVVNVQ